MTADPLTVDKPAADVRPLLEVSGLGFRYGRLRPWLFRDLDLGLRPGEILSILGPNARGKTTLLKCLAGLLRPVEGSIRGTSAIGYVPQDHGTGQSFSVADMVLMGRTRYLRPYQVPGPADRKIAQAAMERVGVEQWAQRDYSRLSGGQRQLVLIARAVASESSVMILDEPASALDLRNQALVLRVLTQLAAEGMGIIMTTHHPDHALHVSDRCLVFVGAGDTRWGSTEAVLTEESLTEVYGLPIATPSVDTASGPRRIAAADFGPRPERARITTRQEVS